MWKNLPDKGYVYFSVILSLLSAISIIVLKSFLPPVVPLFYGLPVDSSQLVPSLALLIAPGVAILITFINISLTNLSDDVFFKRTLVASQAFISLLLGIAVLRIVLLVGLF